MEAEYRFNGKEKRLSLGTYPDVSLKDARERCDESRKLIANKIDPSAYRQAQKNATSERAANALNEIFWGG